MAESLLLIDDDVELAALLRDYFGQEGFEVEVVHDGARGLERARTGGHACVILDVMLPGMSGLDVLRTLRPASRVPVIMLTARGEDIDRIVGLELGADDYLPKPFNPRELMARVRAIVRRAQTAAPDVPRDMLRVSDLSLDAGARTVRKGGVEVEFTGAEFALLEHLLRNRGRIVTRESIFEHVLGRRFSPFDRSIDVHVSNIRKKLGPTPSGRERIKTVRGTGYVYIEEER